mmetsp:Transcript_61626/g.98180  ORF Transcript_61626/g.98180 Transcript_61626/m.98180 type:complete len:910 (-) Transcript_61626:83-2812(-)
MGVPAFFQWLLQKYPCIVRELLTEHPFQCDYLYLDMNGIIHPCCHPPADPKPRNEQEMIEFMCRYLDMLLTYVVPNKLLFIAIDGAPPTAKLVHQRGRRFTKDYEMRVKPQATSGDAEEEEWDSNQITPGTQFMRKVTDGLTAYIEQKLAGHSNRNFKVILSDWRVPGEGEHKILDFIRNIRYRGDYQANSKHVLFSNDADMIFLTLLLHEPNAYLMRDIPNKHKGIFNTKYNLVHFKKLTKYLSLDLSATKLNYTQFDYELNRVIDDFVFLSFFLGNDFIPCLPFMNMRDGAFEYIMQKYMDCAPLLPSYLVNGSRVNFDALNVFISTLANEEKEVFKWRSICFSRRCRDMLRKATIDTQSNSTSSSNTPPTKKRKLNNGETQESSSRTLAEQTQKNSNKLHFSNLGKRALSDIGFIKFDRNGYNKRYYQRKFRHNQNHHAFASALTLEYYRALSWIQHYYYSGVLSWDWVYPHHFAPLASDMAACKLSLTHDSLWSDYPTSKPISPLTQLSVVMPKQSAKIALPAPYFDAIFGEKSRVRKYFPISFEFDLYFKQLEWESTPLIPNIDLKAVRLALQAKRKQLDHAAQQNDKFGDSLLFLHAQSAQTAQQVSQQWGCFVKNGDAEKDGANSRVHKIEIDIPSTVDVCNANRICEIEDGVAEQEDIEFKLNAISEETLQSVSSTFYKMFMSGKQAPRDVARYAQKRADWLSQSIQKLRKPGFKKPNVELKRKDAYLRELQQRRKTPQIQNTEAKKKPSAEQEIDSPKDGDLISKLQSVGMAKSVNDGISMNATELLIDSAAAMLSSSFAKGKEKSSSVGDDKKKTNDFSSFKVKSNVKRKKQQKGNTQEFKKKAKKEKKKKMMKEGNIAAAPSNPVHYHLCYKIKKNQPEKNKKKKKKKKKNKTKKHPL